MDRHRFVEWHYNAWEPYDAALRSKRGRGSLGDIVSRFKTPSSKPVTFKEEEFFGRVETKFAAIELGGRASLLTRTPPQVFFPCRCRLLMHGEF